MTDRTAAIDNVDADSQDASDPFRGERGQIPLVDADSLVYDPAALDTETLVSEFGEEDAAWLKELDQRSEEYRDASRAATTRTTYDYFWAAFTRWCLDPESRWRTNTTIRFQPLPTHPNVFKLYIADWFGGPPEGHPDADDWEPPSPSTLRVVRSAIRHKHIRADLPPPSSEALTQAIEGIARIWREQGGTIRQVRPLVYDDVQQLCAWLADNRIPTAALRDRLVAVLYHQGFGLSEIAQLMQNQLVPTTTAGGPWVILRRQPDGALVPHTLADTKRPSCPTEAVVAWAHRRGLPDGPTDERPLIPALSARGQLTSRPLSRQQVRAILLRLARDAGAPDWTTRLVLPDRLADEMCSISTIVDPAIDRDLALILTGFRGALRRSELVGLDTSDLAIEGWGVRLKLRTSKTDPYGAGIEIPAHNSPAAAMSVTEAVSRWLEHLPDYDPDAHASGTPVPGVPLFRPIDRLGRVALADLGNPATGRLRGPAVADIIRKRIVDAQIVSDAEAALYAGHSLRRGFITSMAQAGSDSVQIAAMSRHKDPRQLQQYVDRERLLDPKRNPAARLGS